MCYTSYMNQERPPEQRYIDIQLLIKALEEEKALLNEEIIKKMAEEGVTNKETDFGQFSLAWRKSWEYSTDTTFLEEQLKSAKKREETNGTAKVVKKTTYLRFLVKKEEVKE